MQLMIQNKESGVNMNRKRSFFIIIMRIIESIIIDLSEGVVQRNGTKNMKDCDRSRCRIRKIQRQRDRSRDEPSQKRKVLRWSLVSRTECRKDWNWNSTFLLELPLY